MFYYELSLVLKVCATLLDLEPDKQVNDTCYH